MSRAYRYAKSGRYEERNGGPEFRAETINRFKLRDLLPHSLNDTPAAEHRTERDRAIAHDNNPKRNVKFTAQEPCAEKQACYDTHRLLGIVTAMAEAIKGSGQQLSFSKNMIYFHGMAFTK